MKENFWKNAWGQPGTKPLILFFIVMMIAVPIWWTHGDKQEAQITLGIIGSLYTLYLFIYYFSWKNTPE